MTLKISTVIPTFNYGCYVTEAIDSVLAQTLAPQEVIVVDDGSTDDTSERIKPYLSRIRYIHQHNQGLSAARNTGIRAATGEWIALLDSDDLWHPQKLEIQLQAAREFPNVGLIGAIDGLDLTTPLELNARVEPLTTRDFLMDRRFGPSSAVIRRTCFDKVGLFDETLKSVEDRDMWLRISVHFTCACVHSPCWWYRQHPNQMNRNPRRMSENYERVLQKFFFENPQYKTLKSLAWAYQQLDSAVSQIEAGQRVGAISNLARSWANWPYKFPYTRIQSSALRLKLLIRALLGEQLFKRFVVRN